jgi:hypothetical protein
VTVGPARAVALLAALGCAACTSAPRAHVQRQAVADRHPRSATEASLSGSADADHDGALDSDERLLGRDLHASRVIYVAPYGDDSAPGNFRRPRRSLQAAVDVAPDGAAILVLPGHYAGAVLTTAYRRRVTIEGVPRRGSEPSVAGVEIWGGRRIAVRGLRLTATSQVTSHPTLKAAQPARDVVFARNDIVVPRGLCLRIRSGARHVSVVSNHIHDCATGIGGPNTPELSSRITIVGNVLERFSADAIQFGAWNRVTIADNVIQDIHDPTGVVHNDAIQLTGTSSHVTIARNLLRHSSQLLFVQPAVGPIVDVSVEDNLIYGASAYAVQLQGSSGVRFVHNTVWASHYGGVLLREGTGTAGPLVPTDSVIARNVLSGYGTTGGARAARFAGNLVASRPGVRGDRNVIRRPRFIDAAAGDYRLRRMPIRGVGVRFSRVKWKPRDPTAFLVSGRPGR